MENTINTMLSGPDAETLLKQISIKTNNDVSLLKLLVDISTNATDVQLSALAEIKKYASVKEMNAFMNNNYEIDTECDVRNIDEDELIGEIQDRDLLPNQYDKLFRSIIPWVSATADNGIRIVDNMDAHEHAKFDKMYNNNEQKSFYDDLKQRVLDRFNAKMTLDELEYIAKKNNIEL